MSWKSIELQVALPRTQDAGKLQEQMSKQNQHFQESLAQSQLKQELEKKKRVQKFDDVENLNIQKEEQEKANNNQTKNSNQEKSRQKESEHPYLGLNFDITR